MSFSFSSFTQAESVAVIEFDQFDQFFTHPEKPTANKFSAVILIIRGQIPGTREGFL
jgi:hypothetical protein